jgi:hypothetical protein
MITVGSEAKTRHVYRRRIPDGAERNPGLPRGVDAVPDFAPLHPGYACSREAWRKGWTTLRGVIPPAIFSPMNSDLKSFLSQTMGG